MVVNSPVDLRVPYAEKESAKALGARWDSERRVWYAPAGLDLSSFGRWLPDSFRSAGPSPSAEASPATQKGESLFEFLARVRSIVEGALPQAVWVRAEISELREKNGNVYLQLAERNDRGDILAQTKGIIWRSRSAAITAKFEEVTGEGLKTDIKILFLAKARYDPLYGFDLIIEDIDPSFTLGDLAAKLARIREALAAERIQDRNKKLPAPVEFVRVAVISPETSAGLGDFLRETDRLEAAGLCHFRIFHAMFQGVEAPTTLRAAANEAIAAHRESPFDALVIIRGGGSVTDLAWLNDLELARLLCRCPIPVLTGIGHERDSTILDEIAHRRFDTPSKVALHITTTIRDNAVTALASLEQIRVQVGRILSRERTTLSAQVDRIQTGSASMLARSRNDRDRQVALIRASVGFRLREAITSVEAERERVRAEANNVLCEADLRIGRMSETITHKAMFQVQEERADIERLVQSLVLTTDAAVDECHKRLEQLRCDLDRESSRMLDKAEDGLSNALAGIRSGTTRMIEQARGEIGQSARLIVGLGPASTLQRGFAIARDEDGRPLTSRAAAVERASFEVEFRDGRLPVVNRAYEGDGGA